MNNKILISTVFVICLLSFSTAHAGDQVHSSKKIEFGESDLTYRVDKDVHKLGGQDVVDDKGDTIGTVENFLVSDPGNVQYAIISIGGFLGIGDKLVAVPTKHLQMNQDKGNVTLKHVSRKDLENAPAFEYEKAETGTERFPEYGPEQN